MCQAALSFPSPPEGKSNQVHSLNCSLVEFTHCHRAIRLGNECRKLLPTTPVSYDPASPSPSTGNRGVVLTKAFPRSHPRSHDPLGCVSSIEVFKVIPLVGMVRPHPKPSHLSCRSRPLISQLPVKLSSKRFVTMLPNAPAPLQD